ncbi:MAG: SDR family NAD(P)-dependent oxidoreductase [Acidimicrobiia bacterium]
MGLLDGKVAIVTGAGRGIGRGHALLLAKEGASVVVNDLGGDGRGEGADATPAQQVVAEIEAMGGRAVANGADVTNWAQAEAMVQQAVEVFGGLDILINNAGILRDRMVWNMTEDEWDVVVNVVLKGSFVPARHAAAYWREQNKKTGEPVNGVIISTSSAAGLYGNAGQTNYSAAKMALAGMTITLARDLAKIGVRANAIAPVAATRLLGTVLNNLPEIPEGQHNPLDPNQIAPLVVWLCSQHGADVNGQVFTVSGSRIQLLKGWYPITQVDAGDQDWTVERIQSLRGEIIGSNDTSIPEFNPQL